jgi:putative membrane protein
MITSKPLLCASCLVLALGGLVHFAVDAHGPIVPTDAKVSARVAGKTLGASRMKLATADQKFLQEAYTHGLFEIGAGQLALENSGILEVRILAEHILRNRAGMHEQLRALAQAKGLETLSEELDAKQQQKLELLQEVSGDDDFDLTYCSTVVSNHLRDIKAFQSEMQSGSDLEIKKFAADVAASLKEQLMFALVVQRALAAARSDGAAAVETSGIPPTPGAMHS